MKCHDAQQKVLLEQSGELSKIAGWFLRRHQQKCPACRAGAAELGRLQDALLPHLQPSAPLETFRKEQILDFARRQSTREARVPHVRKEPFLVTWRPAVLYSALGLVLLLGFALTLRPHLRNPAYAAQPAAEADWEDDFDSRYTELGQTMTQAVSDWKDTGTTFNEQSDAESLARQLLELEGSAI